MSLHNKPLTELECVGLEVHGLAVGTPSQLSDAFRHDHINSVLMCDDIDEDHRNEYKTARVVPLYAAAKGGGK